MMATSSIPRSAVRFYELLAAGSPSTTRCPTCTVTTFPPHEECASCGEMTEWVGLAPEGSVYAFTQQASGLRFTKPDVIVLVDLDDGVRVFGVIEGSVDGVGLGSRVRLTPLVVDEVGTLLAFVLT